MARPEGSKNKPKSIQTAGTEAGNALTHTAPTQSNTPEEVITTSADFSGDGEGLRGKENDKNVRAPIGEEAATNKMSHTDKGRMATGKQLNLDASFYERLLEYDGMKLFYENDENGAVEKSLHLCASLVPRRNKSLKEFKGFTDRASSDWECTPVGTDSAGKPLLCYLLFMPAEEYHALKVAPKEARNGEILDALGMGKSQTEGAVMSNVKGIKTYAPNLPTGGKGFEQTHDV